ncbi:MAG TPA: aminotransferase class III-fold pyridoxal phosphate-dependent enzyme [Phycisphaerae bacterium]|nr:aminotransferase class III-fold pyridoxal phosphate-dependent enzyme [Phycisphaerae bacterium]
MSDRLQAEQWFADPRVADARRMILAGLAEHQRSLTGVRPPAAERKVAYDELLKQFGQQRAGNLFFPYLGSGFGSGPLVELADGSVKFDFISGIGVHHFGHGNPALVSACLDAALRDTVMQGNLQQNLESASLSELLLRGAQPDSRLAHCFLTSSGAMANENALKLAFHQRPGTTRILAFEHAFAGRTTALACITDNAAYRVGVPAVLNVDYVPFFDAARPAESMERSLAVLRAHLARFPDQHAAIWCELVQGEGGFNAGTREFFTAVFELVQKHKIAIVADEVQTFGRTSRLFAFQHFGLEHFVDIVTTGKMLQVCATLFTDAMKPGPGLLSQTFTASTSAILAAETILKDLLKPELFGETGRNMQVHAHLVRRIEALGKAHPGWVRGPYGLGGMFAFTPFDGTEEKVKKILHALFANGVIAFYNGGNPTRLRFLPPVPALTDGHMDAVCDILDATMTQVAATF